MSTPAPSPADGWSATAKVARRSRVRWIGFSVLAVGLVAAGIAYQRIVVQGMLPLAQVATGYMARVGCACHFGAGRSLESCLSDREPGMERVSLSADAATRTVTASVPLLAHRSARHDPGAGCVLLP